MLFAAAYDSLTRTARGFRQSRTLRELERTYADAAEPACADLDRLHWLAAVRFFQDRPADAGLLMDRCYALDAVHARVPLAVHDWAVRVYDEIAAKSYIDFYIANRNKNIFRQIDLYVDHLRTTRYIDFPLAVNIETFALCNAACTFCQYPELLRKGDKMPDDLVMQILADLATFPKDLNFAITLAGVSEPLLDKRIFDYIAYLNEHVPQAQIGINTNGAPLTEKTLDRLLGLKIHWLSISMNDHRKVEYENTMQISYDRTMKVLDMLERRKAAGEIPFAVGITRAGDGSIEDLRFIEWAKQSYPHCSNYFTPEFAWVGDESILPTAPNVGCTHWFDLTIRSTGQVAFCCIDGHIKSPHGDLHHETLLEVYNKPSLREMRLKPVKRPDIEQCRTCTSG